MRSSSSINYLNYLLSHELLNSLHNDRIGVFNARTTAAQLRQFDYCSLRRSVLR